MDRDRKNEKDFGMKKMVDALVVAMPTWSRHKAHRVAMSFASIFSKVVASGDTLKLKGFCHINIQKRKPGSRGYKILFGRKFKTNMRYIKVNYSANFKSELRNQRS